MNELIEPQSQHPIQLEPIQQQPIVQEEGITIKDNQELGKQELRQHVQRRVIDFWKQRLLKAKQKNQQHLKDLEKSQDSLQIRHLLTLGLEVQNYLGQNTQFYNLYLGQIQNSHQRCYNPKPFVSKAKKMINLFLSKHMQALHYLYLPVNWVQENLPSYPYLIREPISIKQIQLNLTRNLYDRYEDFMMEMQRLFRNFIAFNFLNPPLLELGKRMRHSFNAIANDVMMKRNLGLGEFVDNRKELVGEMMDWEAEAKKLREKLARENNVEEHVDYDDEYLEGKLDDGMKEDSKQEISSQKNKSAEKSDKFDNSSSCNQQSSSEPSKKRGRPSSKSKPLAPTPTKRQFYSSQCSIQSISKPRILQLKSSILQLIKYESQQKTKKTFARFISIKAKQYPHLIDSNNQLMLEKMEYEQFVELEQMARKCKKDYLM